MISIYNFLVGNIQTIKQVTSHVRNKMILRALTGFLPVGFYELHLYIQ